MILLGREHLLNHTQQYPAARTAVAMWLAIANRSIWQSKADVLGCFPATTFVTPTLASFYLIGVDSVLTAQIAFNSGILIVLAASQGRNQVSVSAKEQ
jgi:mRNA-degrading endonuclease HigB of HigAB toxin-antitoxin module